MHCFWCTVVSGNLVLKEHKAAKWLGKDDMKMVAWLPAYLEIIDLIKLSITNRRYLTGHSASCKN